VHQRSDELSGDYEYDLVHETARPEEGAARRGVRPVPPPSRQAVELDQDMSYDEAHDF
jgi:hypothetical protein